MLNGVPRVTLKQTKAYRQAVQTQVISNVANMYYTLMMLDRQLEITKATAEILKKNAETMEAMKDAAMYSINSAGVEQSKAAYAQVLASIPDIEQSIRETENALSTLLERLPMPSSVVNWKHKYFQPNFPPVCLFSYYPIVRT